MKFIKEYSNNDIKNLSEKTGITQNEAKEILMFASSEKDALNTIKVRKYIPFKELQKKKLFWLAYNGFTVLVIILIFGYSIIRVAAYGEYIYLLVFPFFILGITGLIRDYIAKKKVYWDKSD